MSAATPYLFDDMPPPSRRRVARLAGFLVGPYTSLHKAIRVCRDGVEDIAACCSESLPHDETRDIALDTAVSHFEQAHRLSELYGYRPLSVLIEQGLAEIAIAQAEDRVVDPLIWAEDRPSARSLAKRLAGCLERVLFARRSPRSKGGARP